MVTPRTSVARAVYDGAGDVSGGLSKGVAAGEDEGEHHAADEGPPAARTRLAASQGGSAGAAAHSRTRKSDPILSLSDSTASPLEGWGRRLSAGAPVELGQRIATPRPLIDIALNQSDLPTRLRLSDRGESLSNIANLRRRPLQAGNDDRRLPRRLGAALASAIRAPPQGRGLTTRGVTARGPTIVTILGGAGALAPPSIARRIAARPSGVLDMTCGALATNSMTFSLVMLLAQFRPPGTARAQSS